MDDDYARPLPSRKGGRLNLPQSWAFHNIERPARHEAHGPTGEDVVKMTVARSYFRA
jgi:hypothetical protein